MKLVQRIIDWLKKRRPKTNYPSSQMLPRALITLACILIFVFILVTLL